MMRGAGMFTFLSLSVVLSWVTVAYGENVAQKYFPIDDDTIRIFSKREVEPLQVSGILTVGYVPESQRDYSYVFFDIHPPKEDWWSEVSLESAKLEFIEHFDTEGDQAISYLVSVYFCEYSFPPDLGEASALSKCLAEPSSSSILYEGPHPMKMHEFDVTSALQSHNPEETKLLFLLVPTIVERNIEVGKIPYKLTLYSTESEITALRPVLQLAYSISESQFRQSIGTAFIVISTASAALVIVDLIRKKRKNNASTS